jgi:hypothetical protein
VFQDIKVKVSWEKQNIDSRFLEIEKMATKMENKNMQTDKTDMTKDLAAGA